MNTNVKAAIIGGVAVLCALVGIGSHIVTNSFWDKLAQSAGETLGHALAKGAPADDLQGAAGDTFKSAAIVGKAITTLTATTSLRNDGVTSTIDRIIFSAKGDGTTVTNTIRFALSADGIVATTDLGVSTTYSGGSGYTWATTSTFPTVSQRQWTPGQYIICYSTDGAGVQTRPSSTQGICAVELFKN